MIVHKIANGHVRDYHSHLIGKLNLDAVLSKQENKLIENASYEILHNDENWEADFELEADGLTDQMEDSLENEIDRQKMNQELNNQEVA